jgi:hypothetical protein
MAKPLLTHLLAGFIVLVAASHSLLAVPSVPCPPESVLLSKTDPAYADAMQLKQTLENHGFTVECMFPTKFGSFFMVPKDGTLQSTVGGEACFSTNYGGIDVVFLPKPQTFADFNITERRKGGGYLYRFTGTPRVSAGDRFGFVAAHRQHFLKHDNYLFIASDDQLIARLEEAFR